MFPKKTTFLLYYLMILNRDLNYQSLKIFKEKEQTTGDSCGLRLVDVKKFFYSQIKTKLVFKPF